MQLPGTTATDSCIDRQALFPVPTLLHLCVGSCEFPKSNKVADCMASLGLCFVLETN